MVTAIIIALYIVGIFVAYAMMKSWDKPKAEKVWYSIFWPLVGILYCIHWLHMKM